MLHYQEANLEYWSCLQKQNWYKVAIMVTIVWLESELMSLTSSNKWGSIWPCDLVHHKFDSSQDSVRIEPLKAWHGVIYLEFIIYLMIFQFHFLSIFILCIVLYEHSRLSFFFFIVCDLGALGVVQKIQVTSFLQIDDLFTIGSWV